MEAKKSNHPEVQDKHPDYLKSPKEAEDFGGHANEPDVKENHPDLGNQSQAEAATNRDGMDIEPEPRDTGGIIGAGD
ncbi:hypothetical protein [Mucilaginibacter sp. HD30]